jgi:ankyrin repeat protein
MMAANRGHLDIMRTLIERNADLNAQCEKGRTALYVSIEKGKVRATEYLLDQGADPNIPINDGRTPLILAVKLGDPECCRLLISHGADVHARTNDGATPLFMAVHKGGIETTKILIEAGVDAFSPFPNGRTPRETATAEGHTHLASFLHNLKEDDDPGNAILDAVYGGHYHGVYRLLKIDAGLLAYRSAKQGWTPLHVAVMQSNQEMVDLLIKEGAAVNAINNDGMTPLHYAAGTGDEAMVRLLIHHGADVRLKFKRETPTQRALRKKHECVALLLRQAEQVATP